VLGIDVDLDVLEPARGDLRQQLVESLARMERLGVDDQRPRVEAR
jgi:hypothetical protein